MTNRAFYAKLRIETFWIVGRRSMSVSFLLFYRALSTSDSRQFPLFRFARVHHSIDLLSAWEQARKRRRRRRRWRQRRQRRRSRRFSRVNRDTTREREAERRDFEVRRMERVLNIAEARRRNVDSSPVSIQLRCATADTDRVGAGNGIST